ncbi:MAG TPA: 4-(cytidine 5'-diphospho)-2-C-methyl-D-erythritol kinase [Bryobacteraceae bacterium]|nr:4-(cytidine 5'-diphospho)-2-C-methyl-D-erythritol kinase [Bryobacteraceae bacterium]
MASKIRRASLRSLAKINLDLRVLHKQRDGFHEMRTVFHTISLADSIEVEYEAERRAEISLEDDAAIPDNLIVRAARAVLEQMRVKARVRFRLRKRIPMGGGLGGGSSNAAAVLMALPALAGRELPRETAMKLAAELGSDVPFFLLGGAAVGAGQGTELYPLADLAAEPLLLIASEVHVSTPEAYRALNRGGEFADAPQALRKFQNYVWALEQAHSAAAVSELSANDFEPSVFARHPQLGAIAARLRKLGSRLAPASVRMTGSGSAIFCLFRSMVELLRAEEALRLDPSLEGCRILRASLVSRQKYRRMWRRQVGGG